jgi:aspartate/glutamate racemase
MIPSSADQAAVMEVIYGIKSGDQTTSTDRMVRLAAKLSQDGADVLLLGRTELSLYYPNSRRRVIMS